MHVMVYGPRTVSCHTGIRTSWARLKTICTRSFSATVRVKRTRNIPPSDIIQKLHPKDSLEGVQLVLAQHRLDHKAVRCTMQELKAQKRFDLVGILFSETLKHGGAKVGLKEFTAGISACARAQTWQLAVHLFNSMSKAKVVANVFSYNSTISACEKGGQWQLAMQLLDSMRTATICADVISYSATISACEKGGQWQVAMHLFDSMHKVQVDADVISYNATISACEKGGQWQRGRAPV